MTDMEDMGEIKMIKIIVNEFNKSAFEPRDRAEDLLAEAGLKETVVRKLISSNEETLMKMNHKTFLAAGFALNRRLFQSFDERVEFGVAEIEGQSLINESFVYDNNLKCLFIFDESVDTTTTLIAKRIINVFLDVQPMELKFNKSILDFNDEEISKLIASLRRKKINYNTFMVAVRILGEFAKFFNLGIENYTKKGFNTSWDFELISHLIPDGEYIQDKFLDYETIMEITSLEESPQNAIVPLLLFKGVSTSRNIEENEITLIKRENIAEDGIMIEGDFERFIEFDEEEMELISVAAETNEIYKVNARGSYVIALDDTPFLLRSASDFKVQFGSSISEQAIQKRMRSLRANFKYIIGDIDFTISSVRLAGKLHSIETKVESGMSVDEAIYKTLVQFGEVKKEELEGVIDRGNVQRAYRLRTNYFHFKEQR